MYDELLATWSGLSSTFSGLVNLDTAVYVRERSRDQLFLRQAICTRAAK